ncbi:MAG: CHRD domain-containing protein [Sphingomonas sp.]|nr:CHRD domain-containing protein [Sphingomonas sp.]
MKLLQHGHAIMALSAFIAVPGAAEHVADGGTILLATLTGAAERPGPGDPDGSGSIRVTVNPGQKRICYELTIAGIATPTAAHIHVAPPTAPGPVAIPFPAPPLGTSSGCIDVTSRAAAQLIAKPGNYYFNVHNAEFPAGAIRGQLAKASH